MATNALNTAFHPDPSTPTARCVAQRLNGQQRQQLAPPLAYISGSLGILIGADLLNLNKIQSLGVPIASIGGTGTFDGIFLTGIVAVLLTSLFTLRSSPDSKGAISTPKV